MKYNKNEVIKKTKEYVERIQDYLTEISKICLFMRLHETENQDNSNNPITRDDEFITTFNGVVDVCKTALENLDNFGKSQNKIISADDMADALSPIGHMRIEIEHMYCDLDVADFDESNRRKYAKICQNFAMIWVVIEDMDDFLYEVYPDA